MKIKQARFHHSAKDLSAAPDWNLPEFALIGRSNVGKSALVNMLTNQRGLAQISSTPGKTRLLNFYLMDQSWSLVDLPGYGYAKVAKKDQSLFDRAVADYLAERPQLRHCFVLIDSRIPPQKIDLEFLQWIAAGTMPYSLLFTKAEKLSPTKRGRTIQTFLEALSAAGIRTPSACIPCSSTRPMGRGEILQHIAEML